MYNTKKKTLTVIFVLVLLFALGGQSLAAQSTASGTMSPQFLNTDVVDVTLAFDGDKALCGGVVIGKVGTNMITATASLSRINPDGSLTTVRTWSGMTNYDTYLAFDGSWYVPRGYTYRLAFTPTVYRNGTSETVNATFDRYCS